VWPILGGARVAARRTKSHFLANISHEFRMPLGPIIDLPEVICEQPFGHVAAVSRRICPKHRRRGGRQFLEVRSDIRDLSTIEVDCSELAEWRSSANHRAELPRLMGACVWESGGRQAGKAMLARSPFPRVDHCACGDARTCSIC
jgi:signal transduction histidine kinase